MMGNGNMLHNNYPHIMGYLHDCLGCQSECYCGNQTPPGVNPRCCNRPAMMADSCHTECVFCEYVREAEAGQEAWMDSYIEAEDRG